MPAKTPRTLADYVRWAERECAQANLAFAHGTDNARDEAAWLVAGALKIPFENLDAARATVLSTEQGDAIRELVARRITTRTPTAYLLNEAWFAGLPFYVDPRVIVPRSHIGEFLLEQFDPWVEPGTVQRALDLCTGSGCIAIALAYVFPDAQIDASDLSPDALAVAAINVERHGLGGRVQLHRANLFAGLTPSYDLIVTNPPYVDAHTLTQLAPEFAHEPTLAFAGGDDGLDLVIDILAQASTFLTPHGVLIAEVGNSCESLQARFPAVPFLWLTSVTGDESVFLLTAAQLQEHRQLFVAARSAHA